MREVSGGEFAFSPLYGAIKGVPHVFYNPIRRNIFPN